MEEVGAFPHNMSNSSPAIFGDLIFVSTSNGQDESHVNIPSPKAPSIIAVNKKTHKLVWEANQVGDKILHGQWSSPAVAKIGDIAPVPKIAASVVNAQFAYVPYSAVQYATAFGREGSLTSAHTAPNATRKVPFITPSRCAASPMRGLANFCSTKPVRRPSKNKNIPCQSNRRLMSSISVSFMSRGRHLGPANTSVSGKDNAITAAKGRGPGRAA